MANYTNMVATNKQRSEELTTLAIGTINEMLTDGEKVEVCTLVKRIGLSRDFFYKNKKVNEAYKEALRKQRGMVFESPKAEAIDKSQRTLIRHQRNEILHLKLALNSAYRQIETLKNQQFDYINNL